MCKKNRGYDFDGDGEVSEQEEYMSFNLFSQSDDGLDTDSDDWEDDEDF